MKKQSSLKEERFKATVWNFYKDQGRKQLPWRKNTTAYHILVSELMLQQTQVERVVPKYQAFIDKWPTLKALSTASLADVLVAWQGLGYNRRAKYLLEIAQSVTESGKQRLPQSEAKLLMLPGVGPYTANAIRVFAYNQAAVLIETNIRQVYIHHFLSEVETVSEAAIEKLVERTLPENDYRNWYAALMDYGSYLKKVHGNLNRKSTTYTKQTSFKGSSRQVRGAILRAVATEAKSIKRIIKETGFEAQSVDSQINRLLVEGLLAKKGTKFTLPT